MAGSLRVRRHAGLAQGRARPDRRGTAAPRLLRGHHRRRSECRPRVRRPARSAKPPDCRCASPGASSARRCRRSTPRLDVLVVPSLWPENSPLVIHEAFMHGVAVVGAHLGGISDLLVEGVNGFTYEADPAPALAACCSASSTIRVWRRAWRRGAGGEVDRSRRAGVGGALRSRPPGQRPFMTARARRRRHSHVRRRRRSGAPARCDRGAGRSLPAADRRDRFGIDRRHPRAAALARRPHRDACARRVQSRRHRNRALGQRRDRALPC